MSFLRRAFAASLVAVALPSAGWAQGGSDAAVTQDILAVRERVRAAILKKDRAALEALYADNYNHLRDSGRQEVKSDRITLVLSGEPAIETAPEEGLSVQVYGPGTAAVTGVSPIPDPTTKKPALFRWVVVYAKDDRGWKVALSQASRVPPRR